MSRALSIVLSADQRLELEQIVARDRRPYLRERAAVVVKVADGETIPAIAAHGLLTHRHAATLRAWLRAYRESGVDGLVMLPRGHRGFPPQEGAQLVALVHQDPLRHGCPGARWRLADLARLVPAFNAYTISGMSRALHRLGLRLKRGRLCLHSPDPAYVDKANAIQDAVQTARTNAETEIVLFADEASCYRQPTLADTWFPRGEESTAPLSHRSNSRHRLCAGLNAVSGQVVWTSAYTTTVPELIRWLEAVANAYPTHHVTIVWDNWPVHKHPLVLAHAERSAITIVWLPTYAPWLNPIEKLWRWLKHTVLHQHRLADDWDQLIDRMGAFLDQFATPAPDLLRYVGLSID